MTPEEQLAEAFSNWMWELIKPSIARIVSAAAAEAVAGEQGRCLWVIGEAIKFWEEMDGENSVIASALEGVAANIRARGEGE